jgi:hypothetical protein
MTTEILIYLWYCVAVAGDPNDPTGTAISRRGGKLENGILSHNPMIKCIHELDDIPAPQGLDTTQEFEVLAVFGDEMGLYFVGTRPTKPAAKRASAPWHVYVPLVPFEFLGPSKAFLAIYADRSYLVVHVTTVVSPHAQCNQVPPNCVELGLGYLYKHSDHEKSGNACLVGR